MSNIVQAVFSTDDQTEAVTLTSLYQYDYGMVLQILGIDDLPASYEVHFANSVKTGTATVVTGDSDGAAIPDALLEDGRNIYAWLVLHTGETDGETVKQITIPVIRRPAPEEETSDTDSSDS